VPPEECKLERNLFLCADQLECVEVRELCDGVEHCHDGSDEGPTCNASKCQSLRDSYDHFFFLIE
jgi:hypothetical protein